MIQSDRYITKDVFQRLDKETNEPIKIIKSPETKQYVLLLYYNNNDEKTFEIFTGRSVIREYIIENIDVIDIEDSMVLAEGVPLEDCITVEEFMNYISQFYTEKFDISEYASSSKIDDVKDENSEQLDLPVQLDNLSNGFGQDI